MIQPGDQLMWSEKGINSHGGLTFLLDDGEYVASTAAHGAVVYDSSPDGNWHTRSAVIDGYQGRTIVQPVVTTQNETPAGVWDQWIANAVILGTDGTVTPVLTGQPVSGGLWNACGVVSQSFAEEPTAPDASASGMATNFYLADHLGTAQLELASGGWPLSASQFQPFGGEIDTETTANHYKFTGKERDAESGLDYFGARYLSSSMGRWMSR